MKTFNALMIGAFAAATVAASAQPTLDYVVDVALPTGSASQGNINSTAVDLPNGVFAAVRYEDDTPSLALFNLSDGQPATPSFTDFTWSGGATIAGLSGFGTGAAPDGTIYVWDQSADPLGGIQVLDDSSDTTAQLVTITNTAGAIDGDITTGSPMADGLVGFSRNLSVVGNGTDRFIANIGGNSGATTAVDLLKATDATGLAFEHVGQVRDQDGNEDILPEGVGRAGVGLGTQIVNGLPRYVAVADRTGGVTGLTILEMTGAATTTSGVIDGYEVIGEFVGDYIDVAIDDTGDSTVYPTVIALVDGATEGPAGSIEQFSIRPTAVTQDGSVDIPTSVTTIELRGSVEIDTTNKKAYFSYRGTAIVNGAVSYTPTEVPTNARAWDIYE